MGLIEILKHFNISVEPSIYGNGHINDTYIVHSDPKYILQRINKNVFTDPPAMMENIIDRKSTRLNSSHANESRMPSSA